MSSCYVVDFAHRRDGGPTLIGPFDDLIEAQTAGKHAKSGRFDIRTVYPPQGADTTPGPDPWKETTHGESDR